LQLELERFKELGATVVAVSPQTPNSSLSTTQINHLGFEVLSDAGNKVAQQFGIVFQLPAELRPIYASFGIDLPSANGDDTFGLPVTATYIIDKNRKIRFAFVDTDYTKRAEPEEIIEVLSRISQ